MQNHREKSAYSRCMRIYKIYIWGLHEQCISEMADVETSVFVDYNTWTWIEPLIMLKSRLSSSSEMKELCRSKVLQVLEKGKPLEVKIKKRVFQRILNGEELGIDLIQAGKDSGNRDATIEAYLRCIMQAVMIAEMGGSPLFSKEQAENLLEKLLLEVRTYDTFSA